MRRILRKWLLLLPASLLALCLLAVMGVLISNRSLPTSSTVIERLGPAEKARLAEAIHLRQTVGNEIWPGWGQAEIPLLVFNEAYVFLVDYPGEPRAGWREVPGDIQYGGPWTAVPGDTFLGEPYYRQPLPADGHTPPAYMVRVGDEWAASLQTKEWLNISLHQMFREQVPDFLHSLIPYRLAQSLFVGGSDKYVSMILHEALHAYQGQVAADRLQATERSVGQREAAYPWEDESLEAMWQTELDLLREGLLAETRSERARLVEQFLAQRAQRRREAGLSAQQVAYEQEREWLEGSAKYVEMEAWRQGAREGYEPVAQTEVLEDFEGYGTFSTAWEREVDQIARMAGDVGDGRFYYSGMAQARLLDDLRPGWKELTLTTDMTLEDLLAGEGVADQPAATEPAPAPSSAVEKQVVEVFFGNSRLNTEADCGAVFPVTRTVAADAHPAFAALDELFAGPTPAEQAADYHSWFSAETANALLSLKIGGEGTAYVNLDDIRPVIPNASTSCGSLAFRSQVDSTLRAADPGIERVIYAIEGEPRLFYDWMQLGCTPDNDQCDPEPFQE